jgi:hypothetical protein
MDKSVEQEPTRAETGSVAGHMVRGDERFGSQRALLQTIEGGGSAEITETELLASFISGLNEIRTLRALIARELDRLDSRQPTTRADVRVN